MSRETQQTAILRVLRNSGTRGATTWELIKTVPAEYRARISELRRDGYGISAHREYVNGKYAGYFRYFLSEE